MSWSTKNRSPEMRLRNYAPILIVLAVAVLGCNFSRSAGNANNAAITPSPTPTETPTPTPTPKATPGLGETLRRSPGKYPADVKLLENKEFQARVKKIMGDDFKTMKSHFDVQTP